MIPYDDGRAATHIREALNQIMPLDLIHLEAAAKILRVDPMALGQLVFEGHLVPHGLLFSERDVRLLDRRFANIVTEVRRP